MIYLVGTSAGLLGLLVGFVLGAWLLCPSGRHRRKRGHITRIKFR